MDLFSIDKIYKDKRYKQAKVLLQELLSEHQSKITKVQVPQKDKNISYAKLLETYSTQRGGNLYFPYLSSGLGHGPFVQLGDGSIKYDMINGIGVHPGHGLDLFLDAGIKAAIQDTVMQGNLQQNLSSATLVDLLITASGLDHCFLTSSGGMATENALKLIFQKKAPATRILAFENCFIGRTLALANITDKAAYRDGLPTLLHVDYIPFYDPNNPNSIKESCDALTHYISRYPGQHAAMCMELIQGEGGYKVGDSNFFKALITILKEHKIAVFVDEIQTFGRTDELFAFQKFGLESLVDIVTIGKLSQVCATLFRSEYKARPGLISQTFTSSTSAIETAIQIITELQNGSYYGKNGKITHIYTSFLDKFKTLEKKYPKHISGPYGHGGMIACTLFQGNKQKTLQFLHHLFENGVIAFICGATPMRIRLIPPIISIEDTHIHDVMTIFEKTMDELLSKK